MLVEISVKFSSVMARPLKVIRCCFLSSKFANALLTLQIQKTLGKQKSNLSVDQLSQALELTNNEDTTQEEQKILTKYCLFWKYRH